MNILFLMLFISFGSFSTFNSLQFYKNNYFNKFKLNNNSLSTSTSMIMKTFTEHLNGVYIFKSLKDKTDSPLSKYLLINNYSSREGRLSNLHKLLFFENFYLFVLD